MIKAGGCRPWQVGAMSASGWAARLSPAEPGQRYRAARPPVERSHLQSSGSPAGAGASARWRRSPATAGAGPARSCAATARAGRPRRSAAEERRGQAAPGRGGRGGAAGRFVHAARRRRPMDRSQGGGVGGDPARPQGLAATRPGLPAQARLQRASAPAAARRGGGPGGAGGVQEKLAAEVGERRGRDPGWAVEVWAFDEHRLGVKPGLRRQWAPRGERPVAVGRHRYERLYLHGFVHPGTGEVVWFIRTGVDAELLSAVLAAFAEEVGAGEGELVVLVLD